MPGLSILGIGLDIVAVCRIRSAVRRSGERFLKKVFTLAEARYCSGRAREFEHLAARFAAKEATLKALGTGITGWAALQEVEVVRRPSGKPRLLLRGEALRRALSLGVTAAHLSLSHTDQIAAAEVVLEGRARRPASSPAPRRDARREPLFEPEPQSRGPGRAMGPVFTAPPLPRARKSRTTARRAGKPASRLRKAGHKAGRG